MGPELSWVKEDGVVVEDKMPILYPQTKLPNPTLQHNLQLYITGCSVDPFRPS